MSKHTPGPWEYDGMTRDAPDDLEIGWFVKVADKRFISVEGRTGSEALANAYLVAAAPELLEALENVVSLAAPYFTDDPQITAIKEARAAICKAKGES